METLPPMKRFSGSISAGYVCVCVCFNDLGRKVMVIGDLKDVLF